MLLHEKLILSVCTFAVACLNMGSGVMECLCKRGYIRADCKDIRLKSTTAFVFFNPCESDGEHQV